MSYPETIAYLYSLIDYEKMRIERYTPESHNLSRVERLMTGKPVNNSGMECPLRRRSVEKVCHRCEFYDRIVGINPQSGEHVDKWMCAINRLVFMSLETVKTQRETDSTMQEWRNELEEERKNAARVLAKFPLYSVNIDTLQPSGEIKSLECSPNLSSNDNN